MLAGALEPGSERRSADYVVKKHRIQYTHEFGHGAAAVAAFLQSRACRRRERVLFIERDPPDQIVSAYFEGKYRSWMWRKPTIVGSLRDNAAALVNRSNAYNEAVTAAVDRLACDPPPALMFVRYETMVACAPCVMERVVRWLGAPELLPNVPAAVRSCAFDALKGMNGSGKWGRAIAGEEASDKFREGAVGGWRAHAPFLAELVPRAHGEHQLERERRFGVFA